jgi:UDPglucose 6-dehydrogenase
VRRTLAAVERSARSLARHLSGPVVVVETSTVPAGTADRLWKVLRRERPDLMDEIEVVSNPEFIREGQGVEDSLRPSRILVGARSARGFEAMRRLYEPLTRNGIRLIETDIATAELAKHACNAFLALKISYANALARLCERAGGDVREHLRAEDPVAFRKECEALPKREVSSKCSWKIDSAPRDGTGTDG